MSGGRARPAPCPPGTLPGTGCGVYTPDRRPDPYDFMFMHDSIFWMGRGDPWVTNPDTTTEPPPHVQDEDFCENSFPPEQARDAAAQQVAEQINQMDERLEHGAVLVTDGNSNVIALEIQTGDSESLSTKSLFLSVLQAGYKFSDIVGLVHSHPAATTSDVSQNIGLDAANRAPASGDYSFAKDIIKHLTSHEDFTVAQAKAFANNFTNYIIGPDNILRQFDGIDPRSDDAIDDEKIEDSDAAKAAADASGSCAEK